MRGVDPRVGGGAELSVWLLHNLNGRSPRGRGSRYDAIANGTIGRSIPAWAGEPIQNNLRRNRRKVDPRVGGGAAHTFPPPPPLSLVDPRVGGGAACFSMGRNCRSGRSPRGRGSHFPRMSTAFFNRSIPAWAGEPLFQKNQQFVITVDPRVGGGAVLLGKVNRPSTGRSPRGRGSPRPGDRPVEKHGSIPAWAGEPRMNWRLPCGWGVDPRVGGGATKFKIDDVVTVGRSPRGRGSRRKEPCGSEGRGSIPAWAGEPVVVVRRAIHAGVDPRVGGGAFVPSTQPSIFSGRSPRGRGSPLVGKMQIKRIRSIPAWAGEPFSSPPLRGG